MGVNLARITLKPLWMTPLLFGAVACAGSSRGPRSADASARESRWCDAAAGCEEDLGDLEVIVPQQVAATASVPGR
ncbi:MAG: hypothetical protein FJ095_20940 [Deltaproteobacteria bacterium]|nr:hypothetical protein [Deltaproteobacteria bacterium]